jgi:hypothetical protein
VGKTERCRPSWQGPGAVVLGLKWGVDTRCRRMTRPSHPPRISKPLAGRNIAPSVQKADSAMRKYWLTLTAAISISLLAGCAGQAASPAPISTNGPAAASATSTPPTSPSLTPKVNAAPTSTEGPTTTPEPGVIFAELAHNAEVGSPHDVAASGEYAYIADAHGGLRIVNVSNPSEPREVGSFEPSGSTAGQGIDISAPYVYLADGLGLLILDVSDPTAPADVGFFDSRGFAVQVQIVGGNAFVAGREGGLNIADVSTPEVPEHLSDYFEAGSVHVLDVFVSDSIAYVAMQGDGLRVVDASDPTAPQEIGFFDTAGAAEAVQVSGGFAYLADGEDGLRIVDVSEPTHPHEVASYDTPGYAQDIALSGNLAFLGDGTSGLVLAIDVTDPAQPLLAGEYQTSAYVWAIFVTESRVYVANGEQGLRVLSMEFR